MSKVKSVKIKVYPTAYRGENTNSQDVEDKKKIFNPESRLFTEENIAKTYINLAEHQYLVSGINAKDKGSFVISSAKTDNPFRFVLAGYYFELKDCSTLLTNGTYAWIKVKHAGTEDAQNTNLYTNYMVSLVNGYETLDTVLPNESDYTFLGLELTDTLPDAQDITPDDRFLLLIDSEGNVPDASRIKFETSAIHGGEDKPLNKLLVTQDIKVSNILKDTKSPVDTQIDFANSAEKIKTVEATTSVTTPTVFTQNVTNNSTIDNLQIKSKKMINISSSEESIQIKTTTAAKNINIQATGVGSDINIEAKNSVNIKAEGNNGGEFITLQAGNDSAISEYYVLPSSTNGGGEPVSSSSSPNTLASREWINTNSSLTISGTSGLTNVITITNGDAVNTQTITKVPDCQVSDTATTVNILNADGDKSLVLMDTTAISNPTGASKILYKSAAGIKINGSNLITSGYVEASYFNATSDRRLKENITSYAPHKSILDLNVVEFDYKSDKSHHIGCIAQELQEICPEIVHENKDGYLTIEENKIVYLLLNEVKRLSKKVEELEERLK